MHRFLQESNSDSYSFIRVYFYSISLSLSLSLPPSVYIYTHTCAHLVHIYIMYIRFTFRHLLLGPWQFLQDELPQDLVTQLPEVATEAGMISGLGFLILMGFQGYLMGFGFYVFFPHIDVWGFCF